mgnify:CR=1 FL=1
MARRRSLQAVYGQESDEAPDFDPETNGYAWCCGAYWVKPSRLAWCRRCGEMDDWKIMDFEFVEEVPAAVLARHQTGMEENPKYPALSIGKEGEVRLYTCTACIAADSGMDEREIVTTIGRRNKGAKSWTASKERVLDFKRRQAHAETHLKVLLGFCLSEEGEVALRRATEGVGVGIVPASTGAPPATEEVAEEGGRPMAREGESHAPRLAARGEDVTMAGGATTASAATGACGGVTPVLLAQERQHATRRWRLQ